MKEAEVPTQEYHEVGIYLVLPILPKSVQIPLSEKKPNQWKFSSAKAENK